MTSTIAFVGPAALIVALVAVRCNPPAVRHTRGCPGAAVIAPLRPAPERMVQLLIAGGAADPARVWTALRWAGPAALVVLGLVAGPLAAGVLVVLAVIAPRALRPALQRRLLDRRDAQLPAALERLASALRAGSAPTTAFIALAEVAPEPLRAELRVTAAEIQHGAPMSAAVDRWATRPHASPAVRLAAGALGLGVDAGGEVARSMDRVAATLRERHELQAEVHALATQARASAGVLAVAPVAFTALVSTIEPGMVRFLLTTPVGMLCLVSGLGLEAAGGLWMARIVSEAA